MTRACWRWRLSGALIISLLGSPALSQTEQLVVDAGAGVTSSAAMSSNARFVVITTSSSLVVEDAGAIDFYLYDRVAGSWMLLPRDVLQAGYTPGPSGRYHPRAIGVSDDGRYVGLVLPLASSSAEQAAGIIARYDRVTNTREMIFQNLDASKVLHWVAPMSRDGSTFAWVFGEGFPASPTAYVGKVGETARAIGTSCTPGARPGRPIACLASIAVSGDGRAVFFSSEEPPGSGFGLLTRVDVETGATESFPPAHSLTPTFSTGSGSHVVSSASSSLPYPAGSVFDVLSKRLDPLRSPTMPEQPFVGTHISDDGQTVLGLQPRNFEMALGLYDRPSGTSVVIAPGEDPVGLTADGTTLVSRRRNAAVGRDEVVFRILDADEDGLADWWERTYGLSTSDASDAGLDSDADGQTNLQEFAVRSHPTAQTSAQRVFAEGAAGSFFNTQLHLFNPGDGPANVVVALLSATGSRRSQAVTLAPKGGATLDSCCLDAFSAPEFAMMVESDRGVVAEREMTWDRLAPYGSHETTGAAAASTEWFFAEGATIGELQLFYLFFNPGETAATLDVEYLLATGAAVTRQYHVGAHSRLTVWVNQEGPPLNAAELSAHIVSSRPIVAERASYLSRGGQSFAAGSASVGITTPEPEWRFAEGATGDFFDTFLLVGNPESSAVTVQATYQLPAGTTVVKNHEVPARSRLTIWADQEDPRLAATPFSTVLTATGNIIAERAMWWPGTVATWAESHTEIGTTATATKWAVAHASTEGLTARSTFLLLSNPGHVAGRARVTLYTQAGTVAGTADYELPATSRTTAWLLQDFPSIGFGRFGAIIESVAVDSRPAVPISVERASYSVDLAAGSATVATPIP